MISFVLLKDITSNIHIHVLIALQNSVVESDCSTSEHFVFHMVFSARIITLLFIL